MITIEPLKPNPEEFGLPDDRYMAIKGRVLVIKNRSNIIVYLPFVVTFIAAFPIFLELDVFPIQLVIIWIVFTVTNWTSEKIDEFFIEYKLSRIKGYKKYLAYEDALTDYAAKKMEYDLEQKIKMELRERERQKRERELKRKQHQYWMSLDAYEFEKEIALLFEKQGYRAYVTKGSGDGGIDIELVKSGEKGIVQCKRYKNKVGPGPIRDLYGTMRAGKYKYGFIACPSGFSDKAYEFSKGKKIKLIGLKRILEMVG